MVNADSFLSLSEDLSFCVNAEDDSDLVCQPGAQWMDINDMLKKKGKISSSPSDA